MQLFTIPFNEEDLEIPVLPFEDDTTPLSQ